MKKGVAPVMATILIVLIVMFMVGGLFIYINQTQSTITEQASEEVSEITEAVSYKYSITSLNCESNIMILRNNGNTPFASTDVTVFYEGDIVSGVTWTASGTDSEGTACVATSLKENCLLRTDLTGIVDPKVGDSLSILIHDNTQSRACA